MNTIVDHMLFCLSEECAEVSKEACKAGRFGLDDRNPLRPDDAEAQRVEIRRELADLIAVVEMLVAMRIIEDPMELRAAIQAKKRKVLKYLGYDQAAGALDFGQAARAQEIVEATLA